MTFDSAINRLRNGEAASTPSMVGYVKREDYSKGEKDDWDSKYDVTFVTRSGEQFRYVHTAKDSSVSVETPDGQPSLDPLLLSALLSTRWDVYPLKDLEEARRSTEARW